MRAGRLNIQGLLREEAEEFYVYQYLVTAEPARAGQPDAAKSATPARARGPMRFTQDFLRDFDQVDFFGPPFALARYADGERAICMGQPLVSAGPASAVIIHKYWQRARRKQTIVDVGSAIDERLKGCKTRPYQQPGTRTSELICQW